jgi:hypothetical protein
MPSPLFRDKRIYALLAKLEKEKKACVATLDKIIEEHN